MVMRAVLYLSVFFVSFCFGFSTPTVTPTSLQMTDEQKDLLKAFETSASSTVYKVFIRDEVRIIGSGTGFVLKYKNHLYFITNSHVCMPDYTNVVEVGDKFKIVAARKRSIKADLCAARINHLISPPYLTFSEAKLSEGEDLYTVGYPDGEYGGVLLKYKGTQVTQWVTGFDVDNPTKCEQDPTLEDTHLSHMCINQTPMSFNDGRIIPGASGSPVLNADGDLVGVIAGTIGPYSVFVPAAMLTQFLDEAFSQ